MMGDPCSHWIDLLSEERETVATLKSQLAEKDEELKDERMRVDAWQDNSKDWQEIAEEKDRLLGLWRAWYQSWGDSNRESEKERCYQALKAAGELNPNTPNTDAYQEWCSVHGREG